MVFKIICVKFYTALYIVAVHVFPAVTKKIFVTGLDFSVSRWYPHPVTEISPRVTSVIYQCFGWFVNQFCISDTQFKFSIWHEKV